MIDAGDLYVADAGQGQRIRVVVLTNGQFNRRAGRVLVAPQLDGPPETVPSPWRVIDGERVFALDFMLSLATTRLLEPDGHVSETGLRQIRQVLRRIT